MISYIPHGKGEKIRIAFMFQVASFWPSWDSLYSSCIKDDRFETKLYWINEEAGEPSQMKTAELFLKTSEIEFETYDFQKMLLFRPHYAVFQTPYDLFTLESELFTYHMELKFQIQKNPNSNISQ